MKTIIKHKNLTWINLVSPSAKEVSELSKEYSIHPLIAEELISTTMRAKVDVYKDSLYLILHFPIPGQKSNTNTGAEIDFVIGKNFLITSRYSSISPFENIIESAKTKKDVKEKYFQDHAGLLVFHILKELYDFSTRQPDQLHIKINKAEKQIFAGYEKEMVKKISLLKKDNLDFRQTICQHETVLNSFEKNGKAFFGKEFSPYLNVLIGGYAKLKNSAEGNKETLKALDETNRSLLSTKTNEIMKTLTIMAFITFPLMLLSSIFGMNTISTPIIGAKGDFWIITIAMITATVSMFLFFKRKRWL